MASLARNVDGFVTVKYIAEKAQKHPAQILRWIDEKILPAYLYKGVYYIPNFIIEQWQQSGLPMTKFMRKKRREFHEQNTYIEEEGV